MKICMLGDAQHVEEIYWQIGEKYGVECFEGEIFNKYRWAYEQPRLRYVDDGRPFWQYIVSSSTGCSDSQYFEELYSYYTMEKVRQWGEFESLHRDLALTFGRWEFDPTEVRNPCAEDGGSIHIWQGDEDLV